MSLSDKNFYNEASAQKLGWEPEWFGCDDFDECLVAEIGEFQRENDLEVDGLCGPTTYRRILSVRQLEGEEKESYIICNQEKVPIKWEKTVSLYHQSRLRLLPGRRYEKKRDVNQFVVHWDAALNSKSCYEILKRRGLSVQFSIDNNGTIYQFTDANDVCWHAPPVNFNSVGVEVSNAVQLKYQKYYRKHGHGDRPVVDIPKINGKLYARKALGFYPVQVEALKALTEALMSYYPIERQTPSELGLHKETERELIEYSGVVSHYHVDPRKRKWDSACLDLSEIIE
jgi:N-acetyl-anhydromuramyl-L-alanine amidase AmpD